MKKILTIGTKLLIAIIAIAFVGFGKPAEAEAAASFQMPCFPYGQASYGFKQYISGWGYHVADDICHVQGRAIYAAADGVVKYSARTPDSYRWGNLIIIQHSWKGRSVLTLYGHLNNDRRVRAGQTVHKGQRIGTVGPRGSVNGYWSPHTHFGVRVAGYHAGTGSYDPTIHGYEYNCCQGWQPSTTYTNDRRATYDYLPVPALGARSMYNNSQSTITFNAWNTGRTAWYKDGDTRTFFGTAHALDRSSRFADGGNADGWASANRIELLDDTPPSQLGRFRATFRSNGQTGTYREYFRPVVEGGVGWLKDREVYVTMTIRPPGWRGAKYVSYVTDANSGPADLASTASSTELLPGQRRSLKLLVRNTGELDWKIAGTNRTRLATANPQGRTSAFKTIGASGIDPSENWVSGSRASEIDGRYDEDSGTVVDDEDGYIRNGEIAVFSFVVTVPDKVGTIREYFVPVVEGKAYMPSPVSYFDLNILDRGYHYKFVSKSADPATITPGVSSQDVTVRLKNTGRESWPVGSSFQLGTDRARDHKSAFATFSGDDPWLSRTRPTRLDENASSSGKLTVDPSETGEFRFTITIPDSLAAGNYKLYVRPLMQGVGWLPEDYGINFPVSVAPLRQFQIMKTVYSGDHFSFGRGTTMTARVAVKNTGRQTWSASGSNPVRFATTHPQGRSSAFRTLDDPTDPWISGSRASAIDGTVTSLTGNMTVDAADVTIEPGQTALFSVPLTAPGTAGDYREFFSLVQEGMAWFPDPGYNMHLIVD